MLKALELSGFKSFADDTRFEFPAGITVVVGPNGSGKSNIVDAIKWTLGAQSARALRGKEMADVIFKGSGSRKPANTAEATIIFSNTDNIFGVDTEEVRVTRRVYRSGEGEYLINDQPCRLRDIKDMFRGTGVGADAYSLIEQGKVDSLLEASPKERRAIFEEAAGISRFKAKKVEAQRRLERVEQNLLRLSDIVDEVDHRLRRLKSQAGKARRYKEYSERLQSLRTQAGRVDWQRLTESLVGVENHLLDLRARADEGATSLQSTEARVFEFDTSASSAEEELRDCEARAGRIRERTAALQSTVAAERSKLEELDEELSRLRRQVRAMSHRAGDLQSQWQEASDGLQAARDDHDEDLAVLNRTQGKCELTKTSLDEARQRRRSQQDEHREKLQSASTMNQQMASFQSTIDAALALSQKTQTRKNSVAELLATASDSVSNLESELREVKTEAERLDQQASEERERLDQAQSTYDRIYAEVIAKRQKHAVVGERVALLQEIDERMEGIGSGVKKLINLQAESPDGPLSAIRGMVADLITVKDSTDAQMVAVALGEQAQFLVIAGTPFIDALASGDFKVPGRVGFVRLQSTPPPQFLRDIALDGEPGVIGRADKFVDADEQYEHLVQWLLGDAWFVESLDFAVQLHRNLNIPPRFVTRLGEVLERDGRLVVGPHTLELGLIPRRAELGDLREKAEALGAELEQQESQLTKAGAELDSIKTAFEKRTTERDSIAQEMARLQLKYDAAVDRNDELQADFDALDAEETTSANEANEAQTSLQQSRTAMQALELVIQGLESALSNDGGKLETLEARFAEESAAVTAAKVQLAKSEQRLDALEARCAQMHRDQEEREQALADTVDQTQRAEGRRQEVELAILTMTTEVSELHLDFESAVAEVQALISHRDSLREHKVSHSQELNDVRENLRVLDQERHARELEAERIRHERDVLSDRLQEDYGVDVKELSRVVDAEELATRANDSEAISELRRKLSNIGSVNMDALEELNDLETRYDSLSTQYQDLVDAKESLERIIQKINADSRRLFSETLDAIMSNFKVLFRKMFGGGHADIVLEEDVDILESGIDIIATPPGKTSVALSLLSGGERALTAVALLMAIFEYRPSPFCVLDEVDAPLDDSNIGRFTDILSEFLDWTKFVVVSHNKATMTAANTLYGITMQESGISKRVSVRFEDVNESGEISQSAVDRAAS